jgi:replicative DNA helicase
VSKAEQVIEAERTLLGAALVDNKCFAQAISVLKADDFHRPAHKTIFEAMSRLLARGTEIDPVTLRHEIGDVERIGGLGYLAGLMDGVPRFTNVEPWARIIHDASTRRKLASAAQEIHRLSSEDEDVDVLVNSAMSSLLEVAGRTTGRGIQTPEQVAKAAMRRLERMSEGVITGLKTGITDFDEETGGLRPPQLIVFAGRPGMGKSAAGITIADNVSQAGKVVGFFSLEMDADEIGARLMAKHAERNPARLKLFPDTWGRFMKAFETVSKGCVYVDDDPYMNLTKIQSRCKLLQAEHGLDLVVIDYLQLVEGDRRRHEGRQWEIAAIARGMKNLAKDLRVPVVTMSQLSRRVLDREDKRPTLGDLRESGEIEQAADIVVLINRPYEYDRSADPEAADWIVAKHRNGRTFDTRVCYMAEFTTFLNPKRETL